MAVLAEFDAWAHSECHLTHQDLARYTPQEVARLQLGWLRREHDVGGSESGAGTGSVAARKRRFQQRHQQKSEELFGDRGFQ